MSRWFVVVLSVAWIAGALPSLAAAAVNPPDKADAPRTEGVEIYSLDNGLRIVLMPVAGATRVAVLTMIEAGFLDEPAGMTQASHLLEHLACMGATKSYQPNESFNRLSERGLANAETMADHTRYDMMVAAEDIELALTIQAERLTSLRIDDAVIQQEAPRCHSEAVNVEMFAGGPMMKFAFMAAVQAWRHGAERALVKSGLESTDPEALAAFHDDVVTPDRVTLVICGGIDIAKTKAIIDREFAPIPARDDAPAPTRIDWNDLPPITRIEWDSVHTAVILTWAPPEDRVDRALLSVYASLLFGAITADADVQRRSTRTMSSASSWPVDRLPFFVYSTLAPNQDADEAARVIAERVHAIATEPLSEQRVGFARTHAMQLAWVSLPPPPAIGVQVRTVEQQNPGNAAHAMDLVLGNLAIQACMRQRLIGHDETLAGNLAPAVSSERIAKILTETITPDRLRITILSPAKP